MSNTFIKNSIRFVIIITLALLVLLVTTQQSYAKATKHVIKLKVATKK